MEIPVTARRCFVLTDKKISHIFGTLLVTAALKKNLNTGMMIFCCFSQMLIVLLMVTSCDWTSITLLDITDIGFHETKSEEGKRMWLWTLVGI